MDRQLLNLAVEGLISMNQKKKDLWKTYFTVTSEINESTSDKSPDAKRKRSASNHKLDELLMELSS